MIAFPVVHIAEFRDREDLFVFTEFTFEVGVVAGAERLSLEHAQYAWLTFSVAHAVLRWDSSTTRLSPARTASRGAQAA